MKKKCVGLKKNKNDNNKKWLANALEIKPWFWVLMNYQFCQ